MYRINVYHEYGLRRRAARRRAWQAAVLSGFLGLIALMVAGFAISAVLIGDRVRRAREQVERLEAQAGRPEPAGPEQELARQTLAVRRERIDWSPILAAVADCVETDLELFKIDGRSEFRAQPAQLVLKGRTRSSGTDVEIAGRFIARLRDEERIGREFPTVQLEAMQGGQVSEFSVLCRREGAAP